MSFSLQIFRWPRWPSAYRLLLPVLAALLLIGCRTLFYTGYGGKPFIPGTEGMKEVKTQVLDATTMQPIEGAIVVGGYYGLGVGRASFVCARSESAVSDAQGWVTLPNDQDPRIADSSLRGPDPVSAYKRGYQMLPFPFLYSRKGGDDYWRIGKLDLAVAFDLSSNNRWIYFPEKYPDQKSALLVSKERSTIYLMPSTAKTKEERREELRMIQRGPCLLQKPFEFSSSEGAFAIRKAIYRESLEIGFTADYLSHDKRIIDSFENRYTEHYQPSHEGK